MWWIIVIFIVGVGFLFILSKAAQAKQFDRDSTPEKIASEYIKRRSNGENMDQIRDALYKHYAIAKPVEFWMVVYHPMPFGDLRSGLSKEEWPEDALALGEITYTILCHRGIYPSPREGQSRHWAYEYDAMTRIRSKCGMWLTHLELTGEKFDPAL